MGVEREGGEVVGEDLEVDVGETEEGLGGKEGFNGELVVEGLKRKEGDGVSVGEETRGNLGGRGFGCELGGF